MKHPTSHRHHYLPVFYLNGFTNENGEFAVYDKTKTIQSKKLFKPKSFFFVWDRNTAFFKEETSDFIESHYAKLDSLCGKTFSEIQKEYKKQISANDLFNISLFIKTLFWRLPSKDSIMDIFIDNLSNELLGFSISDKYGNDAPNEFYEKFLKDENFRKAYRSVLPLLNFEIIKQEEIQDWKFYYASEKSFHFCSDSPLIYRINESDRISDNDFIIPITQDNLLIHKRGETFKILSPELRVKVDILIFLQAKRYICSKNIEYLNFIANFARDYTNEKVELLKNEVFESV